MKISVIVPVYNSEKYLSDCIESIVTQTYSNLEIILIDDGSTDSSPYICDEFAKRDDRIVVIHQQNAGVSNARNKGLDIATGEIVTFVDSDDTIDSDMYDFLLNLMIENDADITHCGYKHIYADSIKLVNDTKKIYKHNSIEALRCLIGGFLFGGSLCNKLIKKDVVGQVRLANDVKINEDVLFCFEVFMNSNVIVFADYPKYNYLSNESSTTEIKKQEKAYADRCFVNKIMFERMAGTELWNAAGSRYISSLLAYYRFCNSYNNNR